MTAANLQGQIQEAIDELIDSGAETGVQVAVVRHGVVVADVSGGVADLAAGMYPGSAFGMLGGNGSAAFADIDGGTAVAVMRNRCSIGDFTAATRVDHLVIGALDQQGPTDE